MSLYSRLSLANFFPRSARGGGARAPEGASEAGARLDVDDLLRLRHLALRMEAARAPPRSDLPGLIAHRRRGRGLELHDIRAWSEGDDLRHLDRNVTARTGAPHVRTFREERERAVLLVADFRPSMLFGTRRALRSVAAAEALALIGWRAARDGRIGLLTVRPDGAHPLRYGRGARAMIAAVGELAEAHRAALRSSLREDPPLALALEEADRLAGRTGAIVVATALDAPGAGFDDVVARIALRRQLSFVLVVDRFETAPPPGAYPYATASGASGWLRLGGPPLAADARAERLRRLGAPALLLDSGVGVEAAAAALERLDG